MGKERGRKRIFMLYNMDPGLIIFKEDLWLCKLSSYDDTDGGGYNLGIQEFFTQKLVNLTLD